MNDMAHYTPDLEVIIDRDWNAGVVRILRLQFKTLPCLHQSLEGEFPVERSNHNFSIGFFLGAIDDQQILIKDASASHRVPICTDKEDVIGIRNQILMQIEITVVLILSRAWKPCGDH